MVDGWEGHTTGLPGDCINLVPEYHPQNSSLGEGEVSVLDGPLRKSLSHRLGPFLGVRFVMAVVLLPGGDHTSPGYGERGVESAATVQALSRLAAGSSAYPVVGVPACLGGLLRELA